MQIWSSFKILKNLKSNLKPKKLLFFVIGLSHYCEFKIEHVFSNQFSRSLFDHHHTLPGTF